MQTRNLEAVVAVADELHFGRAAALLGVPQPSISQRIQRFERELGFAVFERDRRGVRVTLAGAEVVARARHIVAGARWIEQFARDTRHGIAGELSLAAVGSAFFEALPKLLEPLRSKLSKLEFRVKELETDALLDALAIGSIDIGFARPPFPSGFVHQTVWDEPLVVAVNADNPLSSRSSLTIPELLNERFVFFKRHTGPGYWDRVNALFLECGALFEPRALSEHVTTILGLVALNEGVSIVPISASLPYPKIRFVALEPRALLPLDVVVSDRQQSPTVLAVFNAISASHTTQQ